MLNIYQGFYQNIGPLKNKSVLLNYKDGKIMVKAPIGTGKSFLFFDGPIYALYKSSNRTIINKDSKSGLLQLLFSVDDNYYLVVRKLSQTKSGKDSAKTFLYQVLKNKEFIDYLADFVQSKPIVNYEGNDILTSLKFYQVKLEDLTTEFKQEKELQDALNDLLPAKEVALSTIFLQQNSDNIFEKTPSERIEIFKKVFGILGIDDAKAIIDEKKKEITTLLKAKQETSSWEEKLKTILDDLFSIQENEIVFQIKEKIYGEKMEGIFEQMNINLDKLTPIEINFDLYLEKLKTKQEQILKQSEKYKSLQSQIDNLKIEKEQIEEKISSIKKEIENTKNLDKKQELFKLELKSEKLKLENIQNKQKEIEKRYKDIQQEYEGFLNIKNNFSKLGKDINSIKTELNKLQQNKLKLENDIKKLKKEDLSQNETKLKSLEKELKEIKNIDFSKFSYGGKFPSSIKELEELFKEIKLQGLNLKEKIDKINQDISQVKKEIEGLNSQLKSKKKISFNCEKISSTCPFIEEISKKLLNDDFLVKQLDIKKVNLQTLEQELEKLINQRNKLASYWKENKVNDVLKQIEKYWDLEAKYSDLLQKMQKNKEIEQILSQKQGQIQQIQKQISLFERKLQDLENERRDLKKVLEEKKQIEKDYNDYKQISLQLSKQLEKISSINEELDKIKDKENQIKILEGSLKEQKNNLLKILEKINSLEKEKAKLSLSLQDLSLEQIRKQEKNILLIREKTNQLNNLIQDWQKNKLSILDLKHKLSLYKDLSNIFGKEILMYVFNDYIGNLQTLINYFIQDIVNFTLHIQLDEKGENLDIFVEDEKGKRPVQSLSGGQKTALRIGWILAINKLQNSKLLFLDETINNFDQEAIHKIANKIKEFIEENDIKFYMITHSDILQQMNIWDEVVELEKLFEK